MSQHYLDCRGQRCPMPIVKLAQFTKGLAVGARVKVDATDLAFRADIEAWAPRTGFVVLEFSDGPVKSALIERRA